MTDQHDDCLLIRVRQIGRRGERGSGLLSTVFGVAAVAATIGLAANICVGLWERSTVDAVAYDAARDIATAPADSNRAAVAARVIDDARDSLGSHGGQVRLDLESLDDDRVVLRLRSAGVALLPAMIDGGPVVGALDRTISVRVERP
ncbi:MAG: hypothetical protein V9E94_17915 [Microthrixaceae bacterium]